jgi:hypothetical protein
MSSILDRLKKQPQEVGKKLFAVVAGPRLGGKTTLAGTLPGRTLLLQAAVLESGSDSARELATRNKNQLDVLTFQTVQELREIIADLRTDTLFDNIYVDGVSALTEMKIIEPKIAAMMKTDNWSAFRTLGDDIRVVMRELKELTYSEKMKKAKNTFLTCALAVKLDKNGGIADVSLEAKGNVAVTEITKLGEAVLTTMSATNPETGKTTNKLITKTQDWWPGRIDGLLADQNPGMIEPADLGAVLKLRNLI